MGAIRKLLRRTGLALFVAWLLLPANAFAVTIDQCKSQHARLTEIGEESYGGDLGGYDVLKPLSMVSVDWINSLDEFDGLVGGYEAWQGTETTDELEAAHKALVLCLYEKRIDEMASGDTSVQSVASDGGKNIGVAPYLYDDDDHNQCISVTAAAPSGSGSEMAYGHYRLANKCSYPLKLLTCITADRADGTPSPNYDMHQDGAACPGGGWGGTTLRSNETREERDWYEYNHIKWDMLVCKEGWDFVGEDGESFPSKIIGAKYGCRKQKPQE